MKWKHLTNEDKEQQNQHENGLYQALATIEDADTARRFLQDLCTPNELQAMVDRWAVVGPLMEGQSYRRIYQDTGVSMTTIGRVARFLAQGSGGYRAVYDKLQGQNDD